MSFAAELYTVRNSNIDAILFKEDWECVFVRIDVYDNNVDQAIRVLKKKMIREGMFREMKKRKFFEKPSERKRRKQAEAVRRLRKKIRRSVTG